MGAVLTAAEYATATPINTPPFVNPLFPGAAAIIQPNSTRPQILAIEHQFNKTLHQWTEYKNLTNASKKFIQGGIDDLYLKGITDRNVGLANITIREILEFLFQNYGNITQYDIEANDKKLKEKWDATATNDHPLQETAEALANLATATASNHQALQNLTNIVKELSNQIKAKDRQIEDLIKAMNNSKTPVNSNRSTRWEKKDCGSYCHTHGYQVGPKHTSENCCQPGPNHNRKATCENPMGGNLEGKPDNINT